jgi:hypothetical protein
LSIVREGLSQSMHAWECWMGAFLPGYRGTWVGVFS